ncbi:Z1 domain-containing protein [Actinomyces ruminicola]|uniref:Z1 domain-containing protein n=1 Tax=Actinomyces ruminicola TaxID=332524 RepID=UPI0011C93EED|nr:Z1 domain-containing protein [Actinomyces ruminicola]
MLDDEVAMFYPMFASYARTHGLEAAKAAMPSLPFSRELLEQCTAKWQTAIGQVEYGNPPVLAAGHTAWYPGPQEKDLYWPTTRRIFAEDGWPDERINSVDLASTKVVAHTPIPSKPAFGCHGLVVGYVQSGKTSNYIAVASKMADLEYSLIIVLAGIHNGLRKQTQERLQHTLQDGNSEAWHLLTSTDDDFRAPGGTGIETYLSSRNQQRTLAVIKKNATVLRRFRKWINTTAGKKALKTTKVLVIDDEADQASVATSSINPQIRDMLKLMPKHTYIAYTATPFANVFIDPRQDDLYPKDFILSLPRPDNYFGPETVFGINRSEDEDEYNDGLNMVRNIPNSSIGDLRPLNGKDAETFIPVLTEELRNAIHWFWLATAARYVRGDREHSSMLIHTSIKTKVHDSFKRPITNYIRECEKRLADGDIRLIEDLHSLWTFETKQVPATLWHRSGEDFEQVLRELPTVISACKLVIENGRSDERLDYSGDEPIVAIVVGGNTLSRGLTLEGLVVSVFVRGAGQYDTLLQMGRWFGYRQGYEDLPRIWTTTELEHAFRHLAFVEEEMRSDIDRYQERDLTPRDLAVRIYTHPTLRITGKMGAAVPENVSYAGSRLQTRYFLTQDLKWLMDNQRAAKRLGSACLNEARPEQPLGTTHVLFRDVDVSHVRSFLQNYNVHPDSSELERDLILKFINRQTCDEDSPMMNKWNIMFFDGPASRHSCNLGGVSVHMIERSRVREGADGSEPDGCTVDRADIKTLMSRRDIGYDILPVPTDLNKLSEGDLFKAREGNAATNRNGLLIVYVIDPSSRPSSRRNSTRVPLQAKAPVIGIGMAFPGTADKSRSVQMAVQVTDLADVEQPDETEYEGDEA